jgi:PAS domain S-box-containing protein
MKDENKTKAELLKELEILREEREKGVFKNITERKQMEENLKKDEHFLNNIFESVQDGISVLKPDLTIRHVNGVMNEWYKENLPLEGKKCYEVYRNADKPCDPCPTLRCLESGKTEWNVVPGLPGSPVECIELFSYPIKDQNSGEITGVAEFVRDITERKQAEEELKGSEERLKILFDYAPDPYYISDLKGNFIDGNIAAERLIGYKKEELIGKSFFKLKLLSLADIPKAVKLLAKNLRRLPTGPDEFVLNRKDNSKVTVEISTFPVKIKGRALALGIARDITKRKQVEEETRQKTEDMALINTLNDAVNRGDTLLEILQLLARETKRVFSCHGATAYLVSEDREYLVMQIFTRPPAMIRRIEKLIGMRIPAISIPLKAGSLYRKMLQEGKPQLINDPKTIQGLMAE